MTINGVVNNIQRMYFKMSNSESSIWLCRSRWYYDYEHNVHARLLRVLSDFRIIIIIILRTNASPYGWGGGVEAFILCQ